LAAVGGVLEAVFVAAPLTVSDPGVSAVPLATVASVSLFSYSPPTVDLNESEGRGF
jgi:hypothetical protein